MGTSVAPTLWSPAKSDNNNCTYKEVTTEVVVFVYLRIADLADRANALRLVSFPRSWKMGGVVKPHGRLGWVSSEAFARLPLPTYRRGGLPRPFRGLKVP